MYNGIMSYCIFHVSPLPSRRLYGHYSMYATYWNHVGTKVGQGVQGYSNVESLYIKYTL